MQNYKLTIAYDGSKYNGFQKQSKHPEKTIQGKLEAVLTKLFDTPISIIGSGRTDAGVHAKAQVCNFHAESQLPPEKVHEYLITYLPKDIAVLKVSLCFERFHARYNAACKCYSYTIDNALVADPFTLKFTYHVPETLDIKAMKAAAQYLIGTHDFKAFTSLKSKTKSTVRTITSIDFNPSGSKLIITYAGNGFLQHMVRILTGTLIEIGLGKKAPEDVQAILESKVRNNAGMTAPSQGLCLEGVFYE